MNNEKKLIIIEYKLNKLLLCLGQSSAHLEHYSNEVRKMEKELDNDPLYCIISTNLFCIYEEIEKSCNDIRELKELMELEG